MTVNKFIQKLLNLKGFFVTRYHFKIRYRVLNLWVKPYKNGCLCPYCKRRGRIVRTMYEPRQWRDIPICGWSVFLWYCPREVLCPTHSRVQEDIPWAESYARVT